MKENRLDSYEAPTTIVLKLRFEGIICQSIDPENFTEYLNVGGFEEL